MKFLDECRRASHGHLELSFGGVEGPILLNIISGGEVGKHDSLGGELEPEETAPWEERQRRCGGWRGRGRTAFVCRGRFKKRMVGCKNHEESLPATGESNGFLGDTDVEEVEGGLPLLDKGSSPI